MKYTVYGIVCVILLIGSLTADSRMVQVTTTEPMEMMGQTTPGSSDTATIWFTEKQIAYHSPSQTTILLPEKEVIYFVDHDAKQYTEIPFSSMAEASQMMSQATEGSDMSAAQGQMPEVTFDQIYKEVGDSAMARQIMEMMPKSMGDMPGMSDEPLVTAEVTATGETKKIRDWNCEQYIVQMTMPMGMTGTQKIWATTEITADLEALFAVSTGMFGNNPAMAGMIEEMKKIKGVPIMTEVTMNAMGGQVKSKTEVIDYSQTAAPAGTYSVPDSYTKVDMQDMGSSKNPMKD